MTGTYRHGRTYCQVSGCQARVRRAVEIELPMAWEQDREYTTLIVLAGVCPRHGREIDRRVQTLLSARSALPALLTVIDSAIETEAEQQARVCALEAEAACLREQVTEQRELRELAESALELAQRGRPSVLGVGDFELEAVCALVSALGTLRLGGEGAA